MAIAPTLTTAGPGLASEATTRPQPAAAQSDTGAISGDFETFLTLLTAQMRNQDPLKPVDSTEFVAQLASFSAVEQQIRSNDTLKDILSALSGDATLAGLSEWIGREVRIASSIPYDGTPIDVEAWPNTGSDAATLVVTNDFGEVVRRQTVSHTERYVTWDGRLDDLTPAAYGSYRFTVEYSSGGNLIGTVDGLVFQPVSEVRIVGGQPVLVAPDGSEMLLSDVTAVRAAPD